VVNRLWRAVAIVCFGAGCSDPAAPGPQTTIAFTFDRDLDLLFVIDNSNSSSAFDGQELFPE
jgi:hypothetical protein